MIKQISPSLMCCDFFDFKSQIETFKKNGIEYLHVDIMDGEFVPNYTLGTDFIRQVKAHTNIPLDIHIMVDSTDKKIGYFPFGEGDIVSVHYESTTHLQRVLSEIKKKGAKTFVALNPATPICVLEEILDDLDGVLIMTVNPGYAGQKLIPSTLLKIEKLKNWLKEKGKNIPIQVDGNVSFETAKIMSEKGANIFVAGSSSVFASKDLATNIKLLREAIN